MTEKVMVFQICNEYYSRDAHIKMEKQVNELLEAGWTVKHLKTTNGEDNSTIIFVLQKE